MSVQKKSLISQRTAVKSAILATPSSNPEVMPAARPAARPAKGCGSRQPVPAARFAAAVRRRSTRSSARRGSQPVRGAVRGYSSAHEVTGRAEASLVKTRAAEFCGPFFC